MNPNETSLKRGKSSSFSKLPCAAILSHIQVSSNHLGWYEREYLPDLEAADLLTHRYGGRSEARGLQNVHHARGRANQLCRVLEEFAPDLPRPLRQIEEAGFVITKRFRFLGAFL